MESPEELAKQWIKTTLLFSCNCEQCSRELNIEAFLAGYRKGYSVGAGAAVENLVIQSIKVENEKNF